MLGSEMTTTMDEFDRNEDMHVAKFALQGLLSCGISQEQLMNDSEFSSAIRVRSSNLERFGWDVMNS